MNALQPSLYAQIDNTQKTLWQKHEQGELEERYYDLNDLLKYYLISQTIDAPINDEEKRTNSVHNLMRPLTIREFGGRAEIAPYTPDICLYDKAPDCRGTENIPNTRLLTNMTYYKSQWIGNNLYRDPGLQTIAEQVPHLKLVEYRQTADKLKKGYLKVFSNEYVGGPNQKYIDKMRVKTGQLVAATKMDQDLRGETKGRVIGSKPDKPRTVKNYNLFKSANGGELVPRTEPDHIYQVGEYSQVIYSNPVYDPAARRLGVMEQFQASRTHTKEQMTSEPNKYFVHTYKLMQKTKRDPNATQEDRDKSQQAFLDALKKRTRAPNKEKLVNHQDQTTDADFIEYILTAPRSRQLTLGKNNPLFTDLTPQQIDHFKYTLDNLQEQDRKLVSNAIRRFVKPNDQPLLRLTLAEYITELVVRGYTGRRQLYVLNDPAASEYEVNMVLEDIQERIVTKYRTAFPPRKAQTLVSLLQHEIEDIKHQQRLRRSQNGYLLGNASKAARNYLNYIQPYDQLREDQRATLKTHNNHLTVEQMTARPAAEQQIVTAYEQASLRNNRGILNPAQANQLKHFGHQRQEQINDI